MSEAVTVSVVVPIYNAEKYLEACVDSILTQTLENIEVILVDDGSTDASGKICDQYQKKFPSVFVIHQKNSGAAAARLAGVQAAKGHYVGFVDSDDMISPFMYETLYSAVAQYQLDSAKIETGNLLSDKWPERIASTSDFTVYEGEELREKYIQTYLLDAAETVSMCDKIVRREWLLSGNGEEEVRNTLEDFYINMNMALNYHRCGELKEIFYFVRYRKGSLSRRYNEDDFQVLLKVWKRKMDIMAFFSCSDDEKTQANKWFATYALSIVTKLFEFDKDSGKIKKVLKILRQPQVVQSCSIFSQNFKKDCPLYYRMIGEKQFALALTLIIARYSLRRIYGKVKYGH